MAKCQIKRFKQYIISLITTFRQERDLKREKLLLNVTLLSMIYLLGAK